MRVGPPANVARLNVDESISALWEFANALGLKTDDINERTATHGVEIDAVTLKDGMALMLDKGDPGFLVVGADVAGDAQYRWYVQADGTMRWGDGALAVDTVLQRTAANRLKTPGDYHVGGLLQTFAERVLKLSTYNMVVGTNDDVVLQWCDVVRVVGAAPGNTFTGFAGGVAGRRLTLLNTNAANVMNFTHEGVTSAAANRIRAPNGAGWGTINRGGITLIYDGVDSRWHPVFE